MKSNFYSGNPINRSHCIVFASKATSEGKVLNRLDIDAICVRVESIRFKKFCRAISSKREQHFQDVTTFSESLKILRGFLHVKCSYMKSKIHQESKIRHLS